MSHAALAALASLWIGASAPTPTETHAIIVATNRSLEAGLTDLSYADDDGARYHELLSLFADHVDVLSVLDADTQRLHPNTASVARVPTRRALLEVLDRTFDRIAEARKRGTRTVLYFVYVGHGSVDGDGEGTMHLQDGRFSRSDLFQQVIAKSPATINHIVIDACNAFLLVAKRGAATDVQIDQAVDQFLDRESLEQYPNTGVLLSTSKASDVHEWGRFSAGIFSHEVRSALAGAADVDDDGAVTYDEVRAFLYAANGRIADPRARLEPYVAAPRVRLAEPLFERARAKGAPQVHVPPSLAGRYFLEDGRGVRYADFNMSPDGPVTMSLVPQPVYFLRSDAGERMIPLDALALVDVSTLEVKPLDAKGRGAEELSFRRDLFGIPFGRSFFEGYRAHPPAPSPPMVVSTSPPFFNTPRVVALGLATTAVAAGVVGVVFGTKASDAADARRAYVGTTAGAAALEATSRDNARVANVLYAVGAGLLVSSLVTYVVSD